MQRTIDVDAPSDTAVLGYTDLTASEQTIMTGISDPDVYRVLKVKRTPSTGAQNFTIIGTNFAGKVIADEISFSDGDTEATGSKPFKTVTKVILPPQSGAGQQAAVRTTSLLGLRFPISATGDVQQQGRKVSGADAYTLESVGTIDTIFATVDVGTITGNDSFEWAVLGRD